MMKLMRMDKALDLVIWKILVTEHNNLHQLHSKCKYNIRWKVLWFNSFTGINNPFSKFCGNQQKDFTIYVLKKKSSQFPIL